MLTIHIGADKLVHLVEFYQKLILMFLEKLHCCFHIHHQLNKHISVILVPTNSFVMLVSIL